MAIILIVVLFAPSLYGEERNLVVWGGPAFHSVPKSDYSRLIEDEIGLKLHGGNSNGGTVGAMWKRSKKSMFEAGLSIYQAKDNGFFGGQLSRLSFNAFAIEALGHYGLTKNISIFAGVGPTWVSFDQKIVGFDLSDSLLVWPSTGGVRVRIGGFVADLRYRFTLLSISMLSGREEIFHMGGLFLIAGYGYSFNIGNG